MNNEQWEWDVKKVFAVVDGWKDPRKKQVKKMLEGPIGEQFFTAPASTRKSFHNAFAGGLLAHSLNVMENAKNIAYAFQATDESLGGNIQLAALFHDLGKCGDGKEPHYVQLGADDWRRKRGELYEINPKCPFMATGERGMWLLMKSGIEPTYAEMMALRLNDGMGARENQPYAFREPKLALVVHWADHWAAVNEKEQAAGE